MSKLKDYSILDIEAIDDERHKTESALGKWVPESRVYLKSEADKVIAEKDAEIAKLKEKFEQIKDFVWKKASEELPKEKEIVLCLVENCGCYHYSMNYQENGEWSFPEDVAYWQRLPKEKEMKR